jgi:hypothetical protein
MPVLFLTLCALSWGTSSPASGGGPNLAEVELLLQAQDANEGRYPSGRMRVKIWRGTIDHSIPTNTQHEYIDAQVQWSGENVRTELKCWGPSTKEPDPTETTANHVISLLDRTRFVFFNFTSNVFVSPVAGRDIPAEYRLTPRVSWYASQVQEDYPAIRVFDHSQLPPARVAKSTISAETMNDGTIKVTRDDGDAGKASAVFAPSFDGNVLDLKLDSNSSTFKIHADYAWNRDQKGRVYLEKMKRRQISNGRTRHTELYQRCEVSDFDPDYDPSPGIFELSSLDLNGRIVRDEVLGKTYRMGDRATPSVIGSFEGLIEFMRSRGFASPGRR